MCKKQLDPELENKPKGRITINHIFSDNHNWDIYKLKHRREPKGSRGEGSPKNAQMRKEGIQSVPLPQVWVREDHLLRVRLKNLHPLRQDLHQQVGRPDSQEDLQCQTPPHSTTLPNKMVQALGKYQSKTSSNRKTTTETRI